MPIMVDIETLGTSRNSVILSIGAVEFDETGLGKEFEAIINPESCTDVGLQIDARTVMWWMEQNDSARQKLNDPKALYIREALARMMTAFRWKNQRVWCNGADFDFPILENAFRACGMREPWDYFNKMDYRTMKNLVTKDEMKRFKVEADVAHSALADAKAQAGTLLNMMKEIRFGN